MKIILFIFCIITCSLSAQTITSKSAGGNWNDAATWVGDVVPGESNDVVINGAVSVTNGTSCKNLTVSSTGILQNGGGYGWLTLHVNGSLTNNGTIKNNDLGNSLYVEIWDDAFNNGVWKNAGIYLPGKYDQQISQSPGKYFDCEVRLADEGGWQYTSGKISAASDLTFNKRMNLHGYIKDVGDRWGTIDFNNKNLTLTGDADIYNGIVKNVNDLTILNNARIWNLSIEGNTNIKGRGRIENSNVTFTGTTTVIDTLQNCGGYGWINVHFDGALINNGVIKNSDNGNSLYVEIWGDVHNNGIWRNAGINLPGKNDQKVSQSPGKYFDCEVRLTDAGGWQYNTGKVSAASDLTFNRRVNLHGYIKDVGDRWGTIYFNNKNLTLTGDADFYNGILKDVNDLTILNNSRIWNLSFEGNTNIKGRGRIENSSVTFTGTTTIIDTLQNCGGYGWLTPVFHGEVINHGFIKNSLQGNSLYLDIHGNMHNYGVCENQGLTIYTDGNDRIISGKYDCAIDFIKTGEPASGRIIVEEKFLMSDKRINLKSGLELVVNPGAEFITKGFIGDNGFVANNGLFSSVHNLDWWNPVNPAHQAEVYLIERMSFTDLTATSYKNISHPLMTSSIKQWLRITENGTPGTYKLTLRYNEELLNGNDENTLELFFSKDSGKTWKKISTPLNTTRDIANNTITVGNNSYPLSCGFGDYILCSGGKIYVPSISAAIGGRKQIRVGPPNRYSVSYWNNGDQPTDHFAIVLNTNRGVHIKSVFTKEISTGKEIELPVDSLTYGYNDEAILIAEPLAPKEVRTFDVVLTSEPDLGLNKVMEPITFTAVALWIGGAVIEEYISNTIVEGCYEIWRPVSHDESLEDATIECIGNSMNKAVTVENGIKGVAKKGAEEIIKKTGRVAVWPVMLAKDIFDCLGNTVKGMKDYVNGNFDKQGIELTKVTSWDPNAKEGPGGYGAQGFMATAAPMTYTIFFENKKEATAAAYEIVIVDTLDPNVFDISTVQFGTMSHSMGTAAREGNILRWRFVEIELPPNVTPPEGEGWVKFTVKLKNDLPTGTEIKNRAVIKFDLNPWLATNMYVNTLDYDPPVTTPRTIYRISGKNEIELIWDNNDGSGSGVKNTMVYMANNDGPFTLAATVQGNSVKVPVEPDILYRFYTLSTDNVGNTETSPAKTLEILTSVDENDAVPDKFELKQNYPNPFNPATTISFALPEKGFVELRIFNILGEEISMLVNENKDAGYFNIKWEPLGLTSGIYIYQIKFNNVIYSKKMMYLK